MHFITGITELENRCQLEVQKLEEQAKEKVNLTNKCSILEEFQLKAEAELESRQKEITTLQDEVKALKTIIEQETSEKDRVIEKLKQEKDGTIKDLYNELISEKESLAVAVKQVEVKESEIHELRKKLDEMQQNGEAINILKNENEKLINVIGQRETCEFKLPFYLLMKLGNRMKVRKLRSCLLNTPLCMTSFMCKKLK